MDSQINISAPT